MELVKTDAWESSAESWFREFPYRVGNTKWKWQLEAFTEVGKLPVPGAGWAVPWGPAGWAGVWRLRRGPSPLLKEEEKLRYGGRRKQGCEDRTSSPGGGRVFGRKKPSLCQVLC